MMPVSRRKASPRGGFAGHRRPSGSAVRCSILVDRRDRPHGITSGKEGSHVLGL
jgi:hypothetical protein